MKNHQQLDEIAKKLGRYTVLQRQVSRWWQNQITFQADWKLTLYKVTAPQSMYGNQKGSYALVIPSAHLLSPNSFLNM